jgi:hypothetical protein
MIDSPKPGAPSSELHRGARFISLVPLAVALALVTGTRAAEAQEPAANPDAAAPPATPAPAPATPPVDQPPPAAAAPAEPIAPPPAPTVGTSSTTSPLPVVENAEEKPDQSWFWRAPLSVGVGEGKQRWNLTFYGFVEADFITDSTRSYGDSMGSSLVQRSDTYEGKVGRSQFTMRNTRLGLKFDSPEIGGVRPSAVLESDFFGSQSVSGTSENNVYTSPTFRVRHAYLQLQSDYVDVLAGQTYNVFGWQNYFFPMTTQFLGLPNMVFSRNTQFRLSHSFGGTSAPVSIDIAVAAERPAQRDSTIPDADGGLRLSINDWKGITTPGSSGTIALPASIGVSGIARQFKVDAFAPPPTQNSNNATGWGLSIDALIPVIPANNAGDRGNRLTLTGSFVTGTGIADLITANGGAQFPTLPNPAQANPAPLYDPDIDQGLVSFDTRGVLHTIDWQAFKVGVQYYLPPTGRLIFSANFTQATSSNMKALFPRGGAEIELLGRVANKMSFADANLFWDATPAVRFGVSGAWTQAQYLDGNKPHNIRGMALALYQF